MTKTDIGIYRGLKEKFDPEVHVGFFITTDTGELLLGDQSLGQTISGWEINDGVLILKLNTGKDIRVTFPEATETVKGLLSAADKAQLNALQANLDSKVDKVTGKSLLADSEIEKLAGLPNSTELTNSIATAKAAGDNAQSDLNAHKQNKSNPHEVTKAQVGLGNVTNDAQVKRSEMGVANGVATLDADGKVPASQLPSYVDDIIDVYATYSKSDTGVLSNVTLYLDAAHTQLVTGEAGKIYQNIADGEPQYQFRWTGTIFSQTGASSLILGEVTGTAYDGAKGKANADNIAKIKGTSLSHIKDAAPVTTAADKVSINYECYEGNQYGAAGTDHTADIPAATTSKAGVMSAADKTKLENLNSKLVVADEEDVTAVDGKIKFKDRDTTNGMGYKILRLPENGILTQDMINQANTIYEIRYDFDLNGATITIPENCTLKFEGGKLSNGTITGNETFVLSSINNIFKNIIISGTFRGTFTSEWFDGSDTYIVTQTLTMLTCGADRVEFEKDRVYNVTLSYTLNQSTNRNTAFHISNRSRILIIGNGCTIHELTENNIGLTPNLFYDILLFENCNNVDVIGFNFLGGLKPDIVNTTAGWVLMHLTGNASNFNVSTSCKWCRNAVEYGEWGFFESNLINSNFNIKIEEGGYAASLYGGRNLNITCICKTTHRNLYLGGVLDSRITTSTNGIKGAVAVLLRDARHIIGGELKYIHCDNLDIDVLLENFNEDSKSILSVSPYIDNGFENRAERYNTTIRARVHGTTSKSIILLTYPTSKIGDVSNVELFYDIRTTSSVSLINRKEAYSNTVNEYSPGTLNLNITGVCENGLAQILSQSVGSTNIVLDSCIGRSDRGIRVVTGGNTDNTKDIGGLTIKAYNCPLLDLSYNSSTYNLPVVYFDDKTTVKGDKASKIIPMYISWRLVR